MASSRPSRSRRPPPRRSTRSRSIPKLHQPFVDEYAVGYAKQFPGQISLDLSFNRRYFKDAYAEVDINGIYPDGPNQPFGGFGRVDPNQGLIMQQTNATWSKVVVTNLEAILAKNLSHNFQVVGDLHAAVAAPRRHVESHRSGAVHPARRVPEQSRSLAASVRQRRRQQPRRRRRGIGRGVSAVLGAPRRPVLRAVGRQGRGELRDPGGRLSRPGRRFRTRPAIRSSGRAASRCANGTTQPNPLATSWRFAYGTRSDGQLRNETTRYLQLNLGRSFKFGTTERRCRSRHLQRVQHRRAHAVEHRREPVEQRALSVAIQPASAARVPADAGLQVLGSWILRFLGS